MDKEEIVKEDYIDINKLGIKGIYYEIEKLEIKKDKALNDYCRKYNITSSEIKDIIVNGGKRLVDAILNKIIISDSILTSLISINDSLASWTKLMDDLISVELKAGNEAPIIVFLKEYKIMDKNTKKYRYRTFFEISKMVFMPEPTVKRKYYEYKNGLSSTNDTM